MAFVPQFKHDIFVSYAHADNQPRVAGESGWIDDFHSALQYQLGRRMGKSKSLDIWRDDTLRGNDDFADAISGALDETALMICIMSPSYLESDWCKREFREFSGDDDPIRVGEQYRIFKVEPIEVSLDEQPDLLQRLLGYRFYDEKDPPEGFISEYRAIQDDYRYHGSPRRSSGG